MWLFAFADSHNERFLKKNSLYDFKSSYTLFVNSDNLTFKELDEIENIDTNFKDLYKLYGYSNQAYSHKIYRDLEMGVFDRAESFITANKGFIRGTYIVSNTNERLDVFPNTLFDIEANGLYYRTKGFYLEKLFEVDKHLFALKGNYHNLKELQKIAINGYGYDEANGIRTKLNIDYSYHRKNYITKNTSRTSGYSLNGDGYSFDLGYQTSFEDFMFGFGRENLYSSIYIENMPSLYATLDNINNLYFGKDGYKNANALLSGRYFYQNMTFSLPKTDYLFVQKKENYGITYYKIDNNLENFYLHFFLNQKIKCGYSTIDNQVDIEYFWKNYSLQLSTNIINTDNYNGLSVGFEMRY